MDKSKFTVFTDEETVEAHAPLSGFLNIYKKEEESFTKCALVVLGGDKFPADTNDVAVAMLRMHLQKSERAKTDQKFIVGIRFYGFGEMISIDLISIDAGYHREICYDHLVKMGMGSYRGTTKVDEFDETCRAPFMFLGGHFKFNEQGVHFFDTSGDYGNTALLFDGNGLAAFVAKTCGLDVWTGDIHAGEKMFGELMEFMLEHKGKKDFYEQLVEETAENTARHKRIFTAQNIGALILMKVEDRLNTEEGAHPLQVWVQESTSGGLASAVLLHSVVKNMRDVKADIAEGR